MSSNQISFSSPSGLMDKLKSSAQRFTAPLILATTIAAPNNVSAQDEIKLVSNKPTANEVRVDSRSTSELRGRTIFENVSNKKDQDYELRLQSIIENATKAGILKSQADFIISIDHNGKTTEQPNEEAYQNYIEGIKTRARESFPDYAGHLSSMLGAINSFGKGSKTMNLEPFVNEADLKILTEKLLNNNKNLAKLKEDLSHVTYEQFNRNFSQAKKDLEDLTLGKEIFYIAKNK